MFLLKFHHAKSLQAFMIMQKSMNIPCFRYMLALAFIGKAASLLFFFLAWWTYIPPGSRRVAQNSREEPTTTFVLNDTQHEAPITPATINPIIDP